MSSFVYEFLLKDVRRFPMDVGVVMLPESEVISALQRHFEGSEVQIVEEAEGMHIFRSALASANSSVDLLLPGTSDTISIVEAMEDESVRCLLGLVMKQELQLASSVYRKDVLAAVQEWFTGTNSFAPPSLLEAINEIPAPVGGVRVSEAQVEAALDAAQAWDMEQGFPEVNWRNGEETEQARLRSLFRVAIEASLSTSVDSSNVMPVEEGPDAGSVEPNSLQGGLT